MSKWSSKYAITFDASVERRRWEEIATYVCRENKGRSRLKLVEETLDQYSQVEGGKDPRTGGGFSISSITRNGTERVK